MEDYQNGKIYKIWSLEGDKIYIGSTIQTLAYRFSDHRLNKCSSKILFKTYKQVKIDLIENFPCNSKSELERREGELQIINKEFIVNKNIAGRSREEYYEANKDKLKEYREANKEKERERGRIYREANGEKVREGKLIYRQDNKEKIKEGKRIYYEANKERLKEENRIKYEANKEKIREKDRIKYEANKEKFRERSRINRENKKALKNV